MTLKQVLNDMLSNPIIKEIDTANQCECFGEGLCKRGIPRSKVCYLCRHLVRADKIIQESIQLHEMEMND